MSEIPTVQKPFAVGIPFFVIVHDLEIQEHSSKCSGVGVEFH